MPDSTEIGSQEIEIDRLCEKRHRLRQIRSREVIHCDQELATVQCHFRDQVSVEQNVKNSCLPSSYSMYPYIRTNQIELSNSQPKRECIIALFFKAAYVPYVYTNIFNVILILYRPVTVFRILRTPNGIFEECTTFIRALAITEEHIYVVLFSSAQYPH